MVQKVMCAFFLMGKIGNFSCRQSEAQLLHLIRYVVLVTYSSIPVIKNVTAHRSPLFERSRPAA